MSLTERASWKNEWAFSFGSVLEQPAPLVGDVFPVGAAFGGQVPAEHAAEGAIVYADEAGKRLVHDIAGVCCLEIAVEGFAAAVFSEEFPEKAISGFAIHHTSSHLATQN